ncbi:MAG: hypothetical protein EXS58_05090 [Candidatus Latescibacteria bacterium]|nr:hypothetical protein [Candidatus Latescibacterota bacterium]
MWMWIALCLGWGSVVANPFAPLDDLGDVVLVESEAAVGRVEGRLVWEDTGEAARYGGVRLEQPGMQVVVRTDRTGRYGVEVPAGRYHLAPWIGGEKQEVEVKPGSAAEASARVRSPEGKVVRAGEGRRKKMGPRVHRGSWTTWETQDGLPSYVRALAQDQRGNMWFAHGVKGVSYCDGEHCAELAAEDGLPAHKILALHADQQGRCGWALREAG